MGAGLTGVGAVGVLLHQRDADDAATPRTATSRVVDTRAPEAPEAPDLAVVRGSDAAAATRRAVEALGGMGRFVRSGEKVLVKPNIAWDRLPAHGANTNPTVVAEVVRMCVAAGAAKVVVTDVSCNEARRSFERSGIWRAAQDAGAQVVLPDPSVYEEFDLRGVLGRWRILRQVVEADRLINVPVVKHHGLSRLTAGMKNWYGVLLDDRRHRLHQVIDEGIADLAATFRPALTVLDATLVMVRNGPQGGGMSDVERRDLVAATTDPVAGDAWAASLLGREPEEVPYIGLAERAGLGRSRPPAARRIEITL
ncbi:MAG: DUF362 domain-containing protein [Myxococcota bacterium]|nr:DUF362 domain-containing protein [Myxococcota bacterium]